MPAVLAVSSLIVFTVGCGKEHAAPPRERNELVLRFFNSMDSGDAAVAAAQGEKLQALDKENEFIAKLVSIQQSNVYLQEAQARLDAKDVDGALKCIDRGLVAYPLNRSLLQARGQLRQLRHAEKLLGDMRDAKTSAARAAAMTVAKTGLSANRTAELEAWFKSYDAETVKLQAAEREALMKSAAAPAAIN